VVRDVCGSMGGLGWLWVAAWLLRDGRRWLMWWLAAITKEGSLVENVRKREKRS